jgi:hypothetical protein
VRPRIVAAGTRTRFRFTVYAIRDGRRSRLAGARVNLAGRTARTGRSGRAAITFRFRTPGRRTARATRSGYEPASKTIVVK